jgi:anti-sigma B factor antagonist
MPIRSEQNGNVLVVVAQGDTLDASNIKAFKEHAARMLVGQKKVVLDLCAVEFLDSSGLGAILSCLRQIRAAGGDMAVCCASPQVRTLFELVRMNRILPMHTSRQEAIRAVDANGTSTPSHSGG